MDADFDLFFGPRIQGQALTEQLFGQYGYLFDNIDKGTHTLLICVPIFRCILAHPTLECGVSARSGVTEAEQTHQMKIPRLCDAHLGFLALQSAHMSAICAHETLPPLVCPPVNQQATYRFQVERQVQAVSAESVLELSFPTTLSGGVRGGLGGAKGLFLGDVSG